MVSLTDVLLAMSNIPVDDPIAEIWGRGLQGGYEIIEYTGALPITITADGNALIDYRIYGSTVQDGTPTPENPVDVVGCGVRTGNLSPNTGWVDGHINPSGILQPMDSIRLEKTSDFIPFQIQGSLTYSYRDEAFPTGTSAEQRAWKAVAFYSLDKSLISHLAYYGTTPLVGQVPTNTAYIRLSLRTYGQDVSNVMLNLGSTALPYESYGYKLPMTVSDGNAVQTFPIYLGEAETTRRIKKLVLTGNGSWNITDSTTESGTKVFSIRFDNIGMTDILDYEKTMSDIQYPFFYSSHFKQKSNRGVYTDIKDGEIGANTVSMETQNRWIIFGSSAYTTVDSFKSYLAAQYAAGTPVTVWYVLAEPETGIVNEPLMKIGNYADTVSMEQADVSIPTFAGTTVIDYDGTPKPSQMYVKYRR